jgi:hypothetical protein
VNEVEGADSMYPFGYAQDKLSQLNMCGKTIRQFEEVLHSELYYAFGNIIHKPGFPK